MNQEAEKIAPESENLSVVPDTPEAPDESPPELYPEPYYTQDGCLYYLQPTKGGEIPRKLCNFLPRVVSDITYDDGITVTKHLRIGGTDERGNTLPEVDVPIDELAAMIWLENAWDTGCALSVFNAVEKHVKYAIKATAASAPHELVFAHTGWKCIGGKWEYLLPGNPSHDVRLSGKMRSYQAANECTDNDLAVLAKLLRQDFIPHSILYPCLALVFLTPLNEFLKQVGHEPKFILTLVGHTGSMKSTVAALMLSFYGRFSATDLPMSFRDTANSILYAAGALKDVLTCVDDYHPTARRETDTMRQTMEILIRGYGDRVARERLTPDITLRKSLPPSGNVIVTAEHIPDVSESGTARLFCVEMNPGCIDLPSLTAVQSLAADGILMRCLYGYIEWVKETHLSTDETEQNFLMALKQQYESYRSDYRRKFTENKIPFHNRTPDTAACLRLGFFFALRFLRSKEDVSDEEIKVFTERFEGIILSLAAAQSCRVNEDKATHIFIRKLFALIECGEVSVLRKNMLGELPKNFIGYEDDGYFYLSLDASHKAVKKLCDSQDECFPISSKSLAKALADEGLIEVKDGKTTRTVRFDSGAKRVMLLRKDAVKPIAELE